MEIAGGSTPKTSVDSYWEQGSHHWATPKDLSRLTSPILIDTQRKITDSGLKSIGNRLYPKGTLLLSSRAPIGYLSMTDIPTAVNQGMIAVLPGGRLSPFYMIAWAKENMVKIKNMANGSTFSEISKANFRKIKTIAPDEKIIKKYDSLSKSLYDMITLNSRQNSLLQTLRDELLPKLMSGRIRVPLEGAYGK